MGSTEEARSHPESMLIREFREGDEAALAAVLGSAVHDVAKADYTPEQLAAWAPTPYDEVRWGERIRALRPFVAEIDGTAVGYADLQPSGYIDHFFVAGTHGRRGIGGALMARIVHDARERGIAELFAHVSLTAERFFAQHGFVVEERQVVVSRGVELANARMRRHL